MALWKYKGVKLRAPCRMPRKRNWYMGEDMDWTGWMDSETCEVGLIAIGSRRVFRHRLLLPNLVGWWSQSSLGTSKRCEVRGERSEAPGEIGGG